MRFIAVAERRIHAARIVGKIEFTGMHFFHIFAYNLLYPVGHADFGLYLLSCNKKFGIHRIR